MALAFHFSTRSGSLYAVTDEGVVTVTRATGHPAGETETFQTTGVLAVEGHKLALSIEGTTKALVTSALNPFDCSLLPAEVWTTGATWRPRGAFADLVTDLLVRIHALPHVSGS